MTWHVRAFAVIGAAMLLAGPPTTGASPLIGPESHGFRDDHRVRKDRLHALANRDHKDYSFLNAVGVVWPAELDISAAGSLASSGFLIDRCHVLTNLHTVYMDAVIVDPPVGKSVSFAVGQTEGYGNKGALQGLRFLETGVVVAHGDTIIVDHVVHSPENDWALIQLRAEVDDSIRPMAIAAVDLAHLPKGLALSIAGFPGDLRRMRRDRLYFKDLWVSDGALVRVVWASTTGAILESSVQATRGSSGSPLYGDFGGRQHIVIGMHQAIRGDGIDVSEDAPNIQILFTPATLTKILTALGRTPCR